MDLLLASFCEPEPDLCSKCRTIADCETHEPSSVIPQTLPPSIKEIDITYVGNKSVSIGPDLLNRYVNLAIIKLRGRSIASLKRGVFQNLLQLKALWIFGTSISKLPAGMVPPDSLVEFLAIRDSFLTSMPYYLFEDLKHLQNLSLGFNRIVLENCSTIGQPFRMLKGLRMLELNNVTIPKSCESSVPANFFEPIHKTVQILNLTISNVYGGSQMIFQNFTDLEKLDITLAEQYLNCPANASKLFHYMPKSLRVLVMRRWRTKLRMTSECGSTNSTLFGLKQLPNLTRLDMKYSDLSLGRELKRSVFYGFNLLEELNIGYCRFSYVEDFVFDGCPNLTFVTFDGNPVGTYPMSLYRNRSLSKLTHLKLRRTHINSDYSIAYYAYIFLKDMPLKIMEFQHNYIDVMPFFVDTESQPKLEAIKMDVNYLIDLELGGNLSSQCKYLYNLKNLSLSHNTLKKVKGLCLSIRVLNLAFNDLYEYWESINQRAIAKLRHLEMLDISYNQINTLSPYLFMQMTNLTQLRLSGNNLTEIDSSIFLQNSMLEILDMQANFVSEMSVGTVSHLHKLRELLLEDNRLTRIHKDLLTYLDNKTNSIEIFGLIGNPLLCDCQNQYFHEWIKNATMVPLVNKMKCGGTEKIKLYSFKRDKYACDVQEVLRILFSVLGGIIGAVFVAIPCYKYRWYLLHLRVVFRAILKQLYSVRFEHRCTYDAYVMYNSESDDDLNWVVKDLRCTLETDFTLSSNNKVCIQIFH